MGIKIGKPFIGVYWAGFELVSQRQDCDREVNLPQIYRGKQKCMVDFFWGILD